MGLPLEFWFYAKGDESTFVQRVWIVSQYQPMKAASFLYPIYINIFGCPSQVAFVEKKPPTNAGDIRHMSLIPGLRTSPLEGNGNPLQYSCLENSMDRGAWQATIHKVKKI